MLRNLLILLLSTFLLFSCSKRNNQEVIFEPTEEELGRSIYFEGVEALKEGDAFYAGKKFKEAENLIKSRKRMVLCRWPILQIEEPCPAI